MQMSIENPSVFRHLRKSVLGLGLITLTLGVLVLVRPGKSVLVAAVLFGVYLLASGIAQAIAAFTVDVASSSRVLLLSVARRFGGDINRRGRALAPSSPGAGTQTLL